MSATSKKPKRVAENGGSRSVQRRVSLHPAAKAFNEWLNSEEGKCCTEGVQIGAELHGHYMENRCHRAFNAGWRSAVQANRGSLRIATATAVVRIQNKRESR